MKTNTMTYTEADSEEEAFLIASEAAMNGASWEWTVKKIEDEKLEEEQEAE